MLVAAAVAAAMFHVHLGNGIGDRRLRRRRARRISDSSYKLGIGKLDLDSARSPLPAPGDARQGARRHRRPPRHRPAGRRARGARDAQLGEVHILGKTRRTGATSRAVVVETGEHVLVLDPQVGVGVGARHARRTMSRGCRCAPSRRALTSGRSPGSARESRRTLGVDVTLVRLIFALLALAGGAGIVLYLALWAYRGRIAPRGWRPRCLSPARLALVRSASPTAAWPASRSSPRAWPSRCVRAADSGPTRRSRTAGIALVGIGAVLLLAGRKRARAAARPGRRGRRPRAHRGAVALAARARARCRALGAHPQGGAR